jgi:hypothetical protein
MKLRLNNKILIGISCVVFGGLTYLNNSLGLNFDIKELLGSALIIYGIPSVYLSLNGEKRGELFLSTVLFFIGIVLIVKSMFALVDTKGLVFSSVLFIGGAAFFMLFIDNRKEKAFLIVSVVLLILGFVSTNIFRQIGIINAANNVTHLLESFLPAILIVLGAVIFAARKK